MCCITDDEYGDQGVTEYLSERVEHYNILVNRIGKECINNIHDENLKNIIDIRSISEYKENIRKKRSPVYIDYYKLELKLNKKYIKYSIEKFEKMYSILGINDYNFSYYEDLIIDDDIDSKLFNKFYDEMYDRIDDFVKNMDHGNNDVELLKLRKIKTEIKSLRNRKAGNYITI